MNNKRFFYILDYIQNDTLLYTAKRNRNKNIYLIGTHADAIKLLKKEKKRQTFRMLIILGAGRYKSG